ncbi:MAG: GntR family transcriptional regulator [Chloroflexota bacterium]|nr:GntR family transcriptional regulator [Chloroflexota bacterium]
MSIPLYEQLYNHLIESIRAGKLRAGDRLPSEKELADQFNVSRITSKKALVMLEQAGLIDRIQGKGSFLRADGDRATATTPGGQRLVGVVVPDFSDAYALKMLYAIEETCAKHNLFIVVKRTYGSQTVEKEAIQGLVAVGVAGLIVFPVHGEYYNSELLRLVLGGFPVVLVDRHLKGIPASGIYTDNVSASRALTLHLLDRGCTHIAFISPPAQNTSTLEERVEGYQTALTTHGIAFDPDLMLSALYSTLPTAFDAAHIRRDSDALRAFLSTHPAIDAVIASEYNLALLLSQVLTAINVDVPVVCFDSPDTPLAPARFTHIKQNERAMGTRAVEILVDHLEGDTRLQTAIVDFDFVEAAANPDLLLIDNSS